MTTPPTHRMLDRGNAHPQSVHCQPQEHGQCDAGEGPVAVEEADEQEVAAEPGAEEWAATNTQDASSGQVEPLTD